MSVACKQFRSFGHPFEETVFQTLCQSLQRRSGSYTVVSPFELKGREIDGLIITPHCLFTLEIKAMQGHVVMGRNTDLKVYGLDGLEIELNDRHEDPVAQANQQWKAVNDYLKTAFGQSPFVQALLVFPNGSTFDVPAEMLRSANHKSSAVFTTLDNIPQLIDEFGRQFSSQLDATAQAAIVKAIEYDERRLTQQERSAVVQAIRHQPPRSSDQERVIRDDGSDRPPTSQRRQEKVPSPTGSWIKRAGWIVLVSAVSFLLINYLADVGAAAAWTAVIFLLLAWQRRRLARYTIVAGFTYAVLNGFFGFSALIAGAGALLWPAALLVVGALFTMSLLIDNSEGIGWDDLVGTAVPTVVIEQTEEDSTTAEETNLTVTVTAAPAGVTQLRVIGLSNVRTGPGTENPIVTTVPKDAVFTMLEQTPNRNWYKIRLEDGQEGWIGSTRVEILNR